MQGLKAHQRLAGADERPVHDEVALALQLDDVALAQVAHVAVAQRGDLPPLRQKPPQVQQLESSGAIFTTLLD